MTGEMIPSIIFIGPVYGMRLKHMVEDKWQARGKGRKEMRTHQPTAGRGMQGGLKIGELERDTLISHSMAAFAKESFMERSDAHVFPVCTSCGFVGIYNKSLGISLCPNCSGSVRYIGNKPDNLEILPSFNKQKGRLVNIEIPFATKVLQDELATYMNIGLRFITTADTQKLYPFEETMTNVMSGGSYEKLERPIQRVVVPEIIRIQDKDKPVSEEELENIRKNMQIEIDNQMSALENAMREEYANRLPITEESNSIPNLVANNNETNTNTLLEPMQPMQPQMEQTMGVVMQPMQPQMVQPAAPQLFPVPNAVYGAVAAPLSVTPIAPPIFQAPPPEQIIPSPQTGNNTIIVDTSEYAMQSEGLSPFRTRPLRMSPMGQQTMGNRMGQGSVRRSGYVPGKSEGDGDERITLKPSIPIMVRKLE